jgi:hypothetical protein
MRPIPVIPQQGAEPYIEIEIDWADDLTVTYNDKNGLILDISDFNTVVNTNTVSNTEISFTLDDTTAQVKPIFDSFDIHKRPVRIYKLFTGISRFLVFEGQINSPVVWVEGDRLLNLTALSYIEDAAVGYTPFEGQYGNDTPTPWPMAFGDVLHVPAVRVRSPINTTLKTRLCIPDVTLYYKQDAIIQAYFEQLALVQYYAIAAQKYKAKAPSVEAIVDEYLRWIAIEDSYIKSLDFKNQLIIDLEQQIDIIKAGQGGDLNALPDLENLLQLYQADLELINNEITAANTNKKNVEALIDELEYEIKGVRESLSNQLNAYNQCYQLYGEYIDLLDELDRQRRCYVSSITVEDASVFTSNDILINGLRFSGSFNGNTFNIQSIISLYRNLKTTHKTVSDTNNPALQKLRQVSSFHLSATDASKNLKNHWCLVRHKNGSKHLIYVEDQIDDRCIFRLVRWDKDFSGSSGSYQNGNSIVEADDYVNYPLFGVPPAIKNHLDQFSIEGNTSPQYSVPVNPGLPGANIVDTSINVFNSGYDKYITEAIQQLEILPLDVQETTNFYRLKNMIIADRAGGYQFFVKPGLEDTYTIIGDNISEILEVSILPLDYWLDGSIPWMEIPDSLVWEAQPGATVTDNQSQCVKYVCNIVPCEVISVSAYRQNDIGEQYLAVIPPSYYTIDTVILSDNVEAKIIHFNNPLPVNERWSDNIFVSMSNSTNVVDVLRYLIETYSNKACDDESFEDCHELQVNYPVGFAIFDRPDLLDILGQIAWQSRMSIYEQSGIFYLNYLSKEPNFVKTITYDDILENSLQVYYNRTEGLVTVLNATYIPDYLPDTIRRTYTYINNLNKYGRHESNFDFFIYNLKFCMEKSAVFWLLRYSHTWKNVSFTTHLSNLNLVPGDCVRFNLPEQLFSYNTIKSIITNTNLEEKSNNYKIDCILPIEAGSMEKSSLFWSSDSDVDIDLYQSPYNVETLNPC